MKFKLIALLGVAALLATITTAKAQSYGAQSLTVPAKLTAGTTNLASPQLLDVRKSANVAIYTATSCGQPGITNIYYFAPSVDGVVFSTNSSDVVYITNAITAASQTNNAQLRNVSVPGIGYLQLFSIVTTGTVTNGTHQYSIKIP